jgi:hypothetical protein
MPAHGTAPDEALDLVTKAGGSWWLAIATNRPVAADTTANLADIPPLAVPRDGTEWADASGGFVRHATGVTMPAATADTTAAAWCLFDDEDLTVLRWSRWFDEDREIPEGLELPVPAAVLELEFTPPTYPYL